MLALMIGVWIYMNYSIPAFAFLFLAFMNLLASIVYQVFQRRWWKGIFSLILGGVAGFVVLLFIVNGFLKETIDGDGFANQLSIPNNVPFDSLYTDGFVSGETSMRDSIRSVSHTPPDFQLYESGQPGLFVYDVWLGHTDSGTLYFKAYELTEGTELSGSRLYDASALPVVNLGDTVGFYSAEHTFTIYEGDWGKPYGARFELWYVSAKDGVEKRLRSKNYVIEGWQR